MHAMQVLAATAGGQVVPARAQMATTLGFHIILACFGIAFPTIVLVTEFRGLSHSDDVAMLLARRWSQVLGVLVAVGAVTGTVLSFEMGLLWPGLMRTYGAVLGVPFGFEGIFFFLEAIFTGIYLYGWQRLPGWTHFWTGIPIALTGLGGAVAVMAANSWMNEPGGFTLSHGRVVAVNPWAVFFNRATLYETPHMILAAYMVVGFMVASVYAAGILRGHRDRYHRLGFGIPFTIAAILTPVQIFIGDTAARAIASQQPVKFAAIEYVTRTGRGVPEYLGGFGAIASGRVPANPAHTDLAVWTGPTSLLIGALFVAVCAYLAAVFLTQEASRRGDHRLRRYFARRAAISGAISGALSLATLLEVRSSNPALYHGLTSRALPLVIVAAGCGLAVVALLATGRSRGLRALSVLGVTAVVFGWGVAQYPALLPGTGLTLASGSAPHPILVTVVVVFVAAVALVIPSFLLLFSLHGRQLLEAEKHAEKG